MLLSDCNITKCASIRSITSSELIMLIANILYRSTEIIKSFFASFFIVCEILNLDFKNCFIKL